MRRTTVNITDKQQFRTDCYFFPLNWVAKCLNWVAESIKCVFYVVAFASFVSAIIIAVSPLLVYKALLSIYPPLKEEYRTCAISNNSKCLYQILDLVKNKTAHPDETFIESLKDSLSNIFSNSLVILLTLHKQENFWNSPYLIIWGVLQLILAIPFLALSLAIDIYSKIVFPIIVALSITPSFIINIFLDLLDILISLPLTIYAIISLVNHHETHYINATQEVQRHGRIEELSW